MKQLIVDVGANYGKFIIPAAAANPNHLCIAIEPIPELAEKLRVAAREQSLRNLVVLEGAVTSTSEKRKLKISNLGDKGTTSFLEFAQNLEDDAYWKTRNDLRHSVEIEVICNPLQVWLEKYKSSFPISFIKIDTQGFDLVALNSLGEHWLKNLHAGMLESPATLFGTLYENESYDLGEALKLLKRLDFYPYRIEPNDEGFKEYNVYFALGSTDLRKHLDTLDLSNEIYAGIDLTNQINALTNSLSWKLTKFLRGKGLIRCKKFIKRRLGQQ